MSCAISNPGDGSGPRGWKTHETQMVLRSVVLCVGRSVGLSRAGTLGLRFRPKRDVPRPALCVGSIVLGGRAVAGPLSALSRRYLYAWQVGYVETVRAASGADGGVASAEHDTRFVRWSRIREFRGTGEEMVPTNGLLILLAAKDPMDAGWTCTDLLSGAPPDVAGCLGRR
jgi:hypothetical protein